jgi:hypothetical protein
LGYSVAGAAVPIVNERVAALFSTLAPDEVQLIPVRVEAQVEKYFILNALRLVRCIDDAACEEVQYWTPEDGQPDLVGEYRVVVGMRIDPAKVGDARVFRPWGWPVVLIVSEELQSALEHLGVQGAKFADVTGPGPTGKLQSQPVQKHGELLRQIEAAREATYHSLGELEEEAIVPSVPGGPLWPGQSQAWRIIHRPEGRTLLATEGLANPFIDRDEPSAGFGLELVMETDEPMGSVAGSWQLQLLQRVGDEVAEHERVRAWLRKGLLSMEVSGENLPHALVCAEGRVGVLLGVESKKLPRGFITPAGPVRLVTVKALLPEELTYLVKHGRVGPAELAERFVKSGEEHMTRAWRNPVV